MKSFQLTREEKAIKAAIDRGEYRPATPAEFQVIVDALERHKKDAVISIRLNSKDLELFKKKAKASGIPYQTLIAELIHHHATH
jgi:predicted DNA binding CopG/RHH family protein